MSKQRQIDLITKMFMCQYAVQNLLTEISALEVDAQVPATEKLSQIKNIRTKLTKVSTEIDSLKRELTLLNTRNVN